jgi:hypothetical protein
MEAEEMVGVIEHAFANKLIQLLRPGSQLSL